MMGDRLVVSSAALAGLLFCSVPAGALGAPERERDRAGLLEQASTGEPSIEEMLAVIAEAEAALERERATPVVEGGQKAPPAVRTEAKATKAIDVRAVLKAVEARGSRRAAYYQKRKKLWHLCNLYVRFEKDRPAAQICTEMMRRRAYNIDLSPVPNLRELLYVDVSFYFASSGERSGYFDCLHARVLGRLGDETGARRALEEAKAKQAGGVGWRFYERELEAAASFVEGYPAAVKGLAELGASLKASPDAEKHWQLVRLCAPHSNRAVKPLTWLGGLLVMLTKYPAHEQVERGAVHWELFRAFHLFEMHENAAEVADVLLTSFPRERRVARGDALWQKAESLVRFGVLQEEFGNREAARSYRRAREAFQLFQEKHPDDAKCKPRTNAKGIAIPAQVPGRISALEEAIARLSR